jgi:succinate dehydrogenase/fumarate reductase flavoprotein subunit
MKHNKKMDKNLSRRDFIKRTAVGVGAGTLVGLDINESNAETNTPTCKWHKEADVLVVGYGGAGIVTAITAHDAGAKVIVLEKAPFRGGGNTSICMGACTAPKSVDDAVAYLWAGCGGNDPGGSLTPKDVILAWAEEVCKNKEWWDKMGIKYKDTALMPEFKNFPGASSMTAIGATGMGQDFFSTLDKHMKDRGIEVLFDSPATELIQDPNTKDILGVKINSKGEEKNIKARRAVVLCPGGFEFNEEMKNDFLKCYPVKFNSWKYNTGDGVKMAQKVGADLWHMDMMAGGSCFWFPEDPLNVGRSVRAGTNNYIWVDKFGNRFRNEADPLYNPHKGWIVFSEFSLADATYSRIPAYLVFDETARKAASKASSAQTQIQGITGKSGRDILPLELGGTPPITQDEMIEKGWIKRGETLEALAAAIGEKMDTARLRASLVTYNGHCAAGKDTDFGRDAKTLKPVETPPYYAAAMYPGGVCTHGGARRNGKAQILDPDRKPIPRLYSAGSFGSVMGRIYCVFGGNMAELCAFGRIAGRNAAGEKPWA